jgi:hypothetical protein
MPSACHPTKNKEKKLTYKKQLETHAGALLFLSLGARIVMWGPYIVLGSYDGGGGRL